MDNDMDGFISLNEFLIGFKKLVEGQNIEGLPQSPADWQRVWEKIDLDHTNNITFNEFIPLTLDIKILASEKAVRELFALNATDGSENMKIDDLKELLGHRHTQTDD
jgi:Ca2+-binding EF-hand superfamily protein